MARIVPLFESDEIRLYRFDHPVEHEDQPYEARAEAFRVSFVEEGRFSLEIGEGRWRVGAGDVMLSHPGMRYRATFEGVGFNDRCISLIYLAAGDDRFDAARGWASAGRPVLRASNRLRYLRWTLQRAGAEGAPMLAEYCASEIFREHDGRSSSEPYRERKFAWYAERIHAARERLNAEFDREHTVCALARSVGMSMFHFTRVFTELVGRPPHRYLTDVRLDAALAMLRDGRSVTETCFACGFNNLSHFSRSFARRFAARRRGSPRLAGKCKRAPLAWANARSMDVKQIMIGAAMAVALTSGPAFAGAEEDLREVAALDTAYQTAVERNDAEAMAAILHEDMILVLGNGAVYTREDLLQSAREQRFIYEHQVEDDGTQAVRLYGDDTAIVTARLYIKATRDGALVERRLWFSDTYVRTPAGWRYVFGQASLALPAE